MDDLFEMLENDPEFTDAKLANRDDASELTPQLTINWRTIPDEDRAEACQTLASWVNDWLIPRYYVKAKAVPDCWWQHTDLVEELSALHTAWLVAFDPADGGWGPIGWHERFALAQTRTAFNAGACADDHRTAPVREVPAPPTVF